MCKAINFKTEMFLLTQKMPELISISLHGIFFRKKSKNKHTRNTGNFSRKTVCFSH